MYNSIRELVKTKSYREIAKELKISRNTVRRYAEGAVMPWESKPRVERSSPVITPEVLEFITTILDEDQRAPRKQRHTSYRIWCRLKEEKSFIGAESTIRKTVGALRGTQVEVFMPLSFDPGEAIQVDWGEATVDIAGCKRNVNLLCFRLCYSAACFVIAYPSQREEAFLDGHVAAFNFFKGIPKNLIYDNLRTAVKEGWGKQAVEQEGLKRVKAHYAFDTRFCNPSSGNEKGLVENLVGFCRRNMLVPIPKVSSWDELNHLLADRCLRYIAEHQIRRHEGSVNDRYNLEQRCLGCLPKKDYESMRQTEAKVNSYSTITFDTNRYSVPIKWVGHTVTIKAKPFTIEILHRGEVLAIHQRSYAREKTLYELTHYLPLLERKPRSVYNARPVKESLIPSEIIEYSKTLLDPERSMVRLLKMIVDYGQEQVAAAVTEARTRGLRTVDAVLTFLTTTSEVAATLEAFGPTVNQVDLSIYDALLAGGDLH